MRIISGTLRGKKLFTPKDEQKIRPTADRAREALFSILISKLDNSLDNYDVLDIFAGTGAIGLEFASRGAKSVTFVDVDLELTKKNAQLCGFKNINYIKKDARFLSPSIKQYDIIFLDAPYNQNLSEPTLQALINNNYLKNSAIIIVETAKGEALSYPENLQLIDERCYGACRFSFFITK